MRVNTYDVAVVGLGAYGSAALMHLAKAGVRVVGVDRFSPPHEMGSSHGESRITRLSIAEGAEYIQCVRRSHELWRAIESEAQVRIFQRCGGLIIDSDSGAVFHQVQGFGRTSADLAQRYGIAHEVLSGREARSRFPGFQIKDDAFVYFEHEAGFVRPEVAVEAQLRLASTYGAVIQNDTQVLKVERLSGGGVRIVTAHAAFEVGSCLLTAGAWLPMFLPPGPSSIFSVSRQVLHWLPIRSGSYGVNSSPIFIWPSPNLRGGHLYGFPSLDGATVKIATEVCAEVSSVEAVDRSVSIEEQMQFYEQHIVDVLPGVSGPPLRSKVCLYTEAPQGRFVVERHPEIAEVTIASCCSGHGFKHSAAIGESLAAELRGEKPGLDLSVFRRTDWSAP